MDGEVWAAAVKTLNKGCGCDGVDDDVDEGLMMIALCKC